MAAPSPPAPLQHPARRERGRARGARGARRRSILSGRSRSGGPVQAACCLSGAVTFPSPRSSQSQ
eukprot:4442428-Pyramimonas_sp.AAC.1